MHFIFMQNEKKDRFVTVQTHILYILKPLRKGARIINNTTNFARCIIQIYITDRWRLRWAFFRRDEERRVMRVLERRDRLLKRWFLWRVMYTRESVFTLRQAIERDSS